MKEEVVCLNSESIKDSLIPLYQPAYNLLLELSDVKRYIMFIYIYIYIYMCVCVCVCVCV